MIYTLKYSSDTFSADTYPARTYAVAATTYANTTINWIKLYLLSSAEGIYSTYQTMTSGGVVISGVLLQVEREVSGLWTVITQGTTDDAGAVQFWLNPNFEHKITATKTGYESKTVYIYPTASTYTIIMAYGGAASTAYTTYREGLTYAIYPKSGLLEAGTYNFSFAVKYINPSGLVLQNCSLQMLNASRNIVNITYQLTNGTYCRPVFSAYPFTESRFGRFMVEINDTWISLESDSNWKLYDPTLSNVSISDFFKEATYACEEWNASGCVRSVWGENPETNDFSRITFFFLVMAVLLAALNFYTNFDVLYPGAGFCILFIMIVIASGANGIVGPSFFYLDAVNFHTLNTNSTSAAADFAENIMNNWVVALFAFMIAFSVVTSHIRRNEGL
jgi:hypothetical protein